MGRLPELDELACILEGHAPRVRVHKLCEAGGFPVYAVTGGNSSPEARDPRTRNAKLDFLRKH